MGERTRGLLAVIGGCLVVAAIAWYEWPVAVGVAGVLLIGAAFRDGKRGTS